MIGLLPRRPPRSKPSARDRGDAARDRRDWSEAVRLYRAHLAETPGDWPIWVQLGHACKEAGVLAEAEDAYRAAFRLAPLDADLHLQLGHLLKLRNRKAAAADAYARALELAPSSVEAYRELEALGKARLARRLMARAAAGGGRVGDFYDVSDLLSYFQHAHHPSGIQRVQVEFCRLLMARPEPPGFVVFSEIGAVSEIDRAAFAGALEAIDQRDFPFPEQKAMFARLVARARPVALGPGATLIVLGAFWVMRDTVRGLFPLKRLGVRIGVYVYDLIPIEHPEYCDLGLVRRFSDNFWQIAWVADFFLTISDYTRVEVERHLRRLGRDAPVAAAPLAHQIERRDEAEAADALPAELDGEPYVLCVCTIEPRKNHALLFALWRALERERGAELPKLVLAGRRGWSVGDLLDQMRNAEHANGRILILNEVSDAELAALYRGCLFTVFPSFVEGWGLPVGESLAFGKPCVASNTSSIPEVGGDLVGYFDPRDYSSAEAAIRALLFDPARREAAAARIRAEFRPRPWSEVVDAFTEGARRLAEAAAARPPAWPVPLAPGRMHRLGFDRPRRGFADGVADARAELACSVEDWHKIEAWGVWSAEPEAELAFRCDPQQAGPVVVYLDAQMPGEGDRGAFEARDATSPEAGERTEDRGDRATRGRVRRGGAFVRLLAEPDEGGVVRIALRRLANPDQSGDEAGRALHVGLRAFGYAPAADSAAVAAMLERYLGLEDEPSSR